MKVLGIDPGFSVTGFSIAQKNGQSFYLLDYGYLSMPSSQSLACRISCFHDFFSQKIIDHQITDIALETPFLGKNAQNFLKLGYLRGILYLLSERYKTGLHEFSPREVKLSLTGFGGASKEQVARVVGQLFPTMPPTKKLDVTDAIAITLCGLWKNKQPHFRR